MTAPEPFFSARFRVRGSVFNRNFEKCKLLKGVCFRNEFREILAYGKRIIVKRNVNAHVMRKLGDGSFAKANFHIYYEIDGEEIKTVLRLWRAGFVLISLEKA